MEFGRVGSFVTIYGEETFVNTELLSVGRSRPWADGEGRLYTVSIGESREETGSGISECFLLTADRLVETGRGGATAYLKCYWL